MYQKNNCALSSQSVNIAAIKGFRTSPKGCRDIFPSPSCRIFMQFSWSCILILLLNVPLQVLDTATHAQVAHGIILQTTLQKGDQVTMVNSIQDFMSLEYQQRSGCNSNRKILSNELKAEKWPVMIESLESNPSTSPYILGPPEEGYCDKNLNLALPFHWLCHPTDDDVTMIDPSGNRVPLQKLGTFEASEGEKVFHYRVKKSGNYRIIAGGKEFKNFSVHPESCYCPESFPDFWKRYGCNDEDGREADKHFSRWLPNSISREEFQVNNRFGVHRFDLYHVSIVNNSAHFKRVGARGEGKPAKGRGYMMRLLGFLQSLLRKVKLPDCEFYLDYAFDGAATPYYSPIPPFLAQGHAENFAEIPGPTSKQILWTLRGTAVRHAAHGRKWSDRKSKAYFRGSLTGKNRDISSGVKKFNKRYRLAMMSQNFTWLDAKIVLEQQKGDDQSSTPKEPFFTHLRSAENGLHAYKYVVHVDGSVAAWRLLYEMGSGSVVIKHKSHLKEWWYDHLLKKGVNFLEADSFFGDLPQIVEWALRNDDVAERIARNAFHTWAQRLRSEDTYCWLAAVLSRIPSTLAFQPVLHPDMASLNEVSPQQTDDKCTCQYGSHN